MAAVVLVGERPLAGVVTAAVSLAFACVAAVFLRRRLEATRCGGRRAVWAVVGVLFVLGGVWELLSIRVVLVPILCIVAGVLLIVSALAGKPRETRPQ